MNDSTTTFSYIENPRVLRVAQLAWVVVVVLNWIIFLEAVPYYWHDKAWLTVYAVAGAHSPASVVHIFWIGQIITGVFALAVGLFIFWQQRRNRAALIFSAMLSIVILNFFLPSLGLVYRVGDVWRLPSSFAFMTTMGGLMLVMLTFPTGRFDFAWTRFLFVGYVVWEIVRFLILASDPTNMSGLLAVTIAFLVAGLGVLIWRYRTRFTQTERQQTKLVILGFAYALFGFSAVLFAAIPLSGMFDLNPEQQSAFRAIASLVLVNGSAVICTILIAFAILRYRLWNIDFAINRSLVYGSLAVVMIAVFAVVALIVDALVGESNVALVASVGAAGLLFNPVYKWSKRFVDRRLYGLNFELDQLANAHVLPPITQPGALSGLTVGDYQVLDFINKGGMGEVYKGFGQNRTVAIKFLPKEFALDDMLRRRFEREARVLNTLDHPNILHGYDAGISANGQHYLIVEYIDGRELKEYLAEQGGRLTVAQAVPIVNQITAALDYLHGRQLVHRDVKPSNVMIRPNGTLTLMDFGLVTGLSGEATLTGMEAIGTIMYMAPEQIQHAGQIDHRADIYALGVLVYQMLTGSLPFDGPPAQVLFAHLNQPAPDPRRIVADLPSSVTYITGRALQKRPADRFATAGDLARALADALTPDA